MPRKVLRPASEIEDIGHLDVVVLAGVDQDLHDALSLFQGMQDRSNLHEIWTAPMM
ncbi:MAG: hypothetical protein WBV36_10100 [Terriglobales bacterium]